jgi:RHS repeat-associated protein
MLHLTAHCLRNLDNQYPGNYGYDKIGNLIADQIEGLLSIDWKVYGKLYSLTTKDGTTISYTYDASGNRTHKVNYINDTIFHSFYVRDAQGNVLATYSKKNDEEVKWNEQHLYGSSRLGVWNWDTIVPATAPVVQADNSPIQDSLMLGSRTYELTNHLGNVLATISDKKIGHDSSGVVDYYTAEVLSQNDYYPFGMEMQGRKYSVQVPYRYGFNGKEKDNETYGEGNIYDYGYRIYNPRIGKFLSVDPLTKNYPEFTPYQFSSNSPITFIDLYGLELAWRNPVTGEVRGAGPINLPLGSRNANGWILFAPPVTPKINTSKATPQIHKPALQRGSDYLASVRSVQNQQIAVKKSDPGPKHDPEVVEGDIFGVAHIGRQSVVQAQVNGVRAEYNEQIGNNIRGGLGGAVGYLIAGDKGSYYGAVIDNVGYSFAGVPGNSSVLSRNSVEISAEQKNFTPPQIFTNSKGQLTNGIYTIDQTGMEPHTSGDLSSGKSQFLFNVDANKTVLDAAAYADQFNLWNSANNRAKVPITNGNVGVLGKSGEQTNYINVYRTNTGFVHGSPSNPPNNP